MIFIILLLLQIYYITCFEINTFYYSLNKNKINIKVNYKNNKFSSILYNKKNIDKSNKKINIFTDNIYKTKTLLKTKLIYNEIDDVTIPFNLKYVYKNDILIPDTNYTHYNISNNIVLTTPNKINDKDLWFIELFYNLKDIIYSHKVYYDINNTNIFNFTSIFTPFREPIYKK